MARFIRCDGCGEESPNAKGKHIANHWERITLEPNFFSMGGHKTINLCQNCLPPPDNRYDVCGWAKSIINFFMGKRDQITPTERTLAESRFNALWYSIEKHMGVVPDCKDWPESIRAAIRGTRKFKESVAPMNGAFPTPPNCGGGGYKPRKEIFVMVENKHSFGEIVSVQVDLAEPHPDDIAVDKFAKAMKEKLALKRSQGFSGWDDDEQCDQERLSYFLRSHVVKGDPVDVGNLAMMLFNRGETISPE